MEQNYYQPLKKGKAESETSFWINLVAFIICFGVLILCRIAGVPVTPYMFLLVTAVLTVSIVCLELIFYPETAVYDKWKFHRKVNWKRVGYKEIALLVTFGCIGIFYWLLPMYDYNDFQHKYFPFLKILLPSLVVGSIPYFAFMDKIDPEPEDAYYKIGYAIIHRQKTLTKFELGNYIRIWLVKAFWLALMQPYMMEKLNWLAKFDIAYFMDKPMEWFWAANAFCFFIDLTYASVGYMMNFKFLNTQTRTAEPTFLGWFVAIMCYWPFWGVLFYKFFFRYDEIGWLSVFEVQSIGWWLWFVMIIGLEFLYSMATVAAGIRFSNLTYRGLWNTGPYKYTKHPAYVFKNISWWLISMPFMAQTPAMAVKLSFLLFGVNIIYYLRAKTEERHLSHYPEYVEYALAMNDKSIFRWVAKILPFLKYKPLNDKDRLF
ncbi:MAG: hypothetical protein J6N49_04020 [Alphaproteobacteria bacterium]|nr:hypothetical protein [Alphaproteobacteria bacterium]